MMKEFFFDVVHLQQTRALIVMTSRTIEISYQTRFEKRQVKVSKSPSLLFLRGRLLYCGCHHAHAVHHTLFCTSSFGPAECQLAVLPRCPQSKIHADNGAFVYFHL